MEAVGRPFNGERLPEDLSPSFLMGHTCKRLVFLLLGFASQPNRPLDKPYFLSSPCDAKFVLSRFRYVIQRIVVVFSP